MTQRFHFRLQSLLNLKQQQMQHTERKVGQLAAHRNDCKHTVEQLKSQQQQPVITNCAANGLVILEAAQRRGSWVTQQLVAAQDDYAAAVETWRSSVEELEAKRQEIESLAQLREREQAEHTRAENRKAQRELEERVLRTWSAKRKPL